MSDQKWLGLTNPDLKWPAFFKCLVTGHHFQNSRTHAGFQTCRRCKYRKHG